MDGAGRVRGWAVTDAAEIARVERALAALAAPELQRAKYGPSDGDPFLYASGDGNHSLAAAKLFWERRKPALSAAERERDPARFALVELVNVHDPGLRFEPIHRVVFGVDPGRAARRSRAHARRGAGARAALDRGDTLRCRVAARPATSRSRSPRCRRFLDALARDRTRARASTTSTATKRSRSSPPSRDGSASCLPAFEKSALFPTVARRGVLPRKAFSLGEAEEKRFYLEARRIRA